MRDEVIMANEISHKMIDILNVEKDIDIRINAVTNLLASVCLSLSPGPSHSIVILGVLANDAKEKIEEMLSQGNERIH